MQKQVHGTETVVQYANTYITVTNANGNKGNYYKELSTSRESTSTSTNTTAKDLKGFVESVEVNHGYFIGRYEASCGSGSQFGIGNDSSYYRPTSKKTTGTSSENYAANYVTGTLWNYILQPNAAKAGRQMYYGNNYVESDLVNSYMWDTAILYIQSMGNTNYANTTSGSSTSLKNTGETGDEKCHIFDMAGNMYEWTTEYSDYSNYPCVGRGGNYAGTTCASGRYGGFGTDNASGSSTDYLGFRVGLWIK